MSKGRASRAQEAETGVFLWVKGQSSLYSKFLASQGHIVIPCLKLLPTKWDNWLAKAVLTFMCIHSCTCAHTHQHPPPTHTQLSDTWDGWDGQSQNLGVVGLGLPGWPWLRTQLKVILDSIISLKNQKYHHPHFHNTIPYTNKIQIHIYSYS